MCDEIMQRGMGWLHEPPDLRDFTIEVEKAKKPALTSGLKPMKVPELSPIHKSLSGLKFPWPPPGKHFKNVQWCSPIEDQGALGSCTANAGVGILEYYERRAFGKHIDASRLFLYKVTRDLLGWTGDTGAYCRTTMGAIALFGAPPEKYWPYNIAAFDTEPSSFLYAFAQNYQGILYHRIDAGSSSLPLLTRIKINIALGFPLMFGFTVYQSISQAGGSGEIPYPAPGEKSVGGHAIVAVGYDDAKKIKNAARGGPQTTGALLIRNSWGTDWGCVPPEGSTQRGYGWLPYEYVEKGQAVDWWSLTKAEWIETGNFGV